MKKGSPKHKAVVAAFNKVQNIMLQWDNYEMAKEKLRKIRPEVVLKHEMEKPIPQWYVNLLYILTDLYDAGYENAWKDREKLR